MKTVLPHWFRLSVNAKKQSYINLGLAILASVTICAGGCDTATKPGNPTATIDDAAVLQLQTDQAKKIEVTVTAPVQKLLKEDTKGLPHQRFLIQLSNETTILVANDLKYGTFVPLQPGDIVTIHGEYIWNRLGGVIHWTHKSDNPNHEGGWIELKGVRYE